VVQPVRVVADGGLSLPLTGRLVASAGDIPLRVLHRPGAPAERRAALNGLGVETVEVAVGDNGSLDLADALRRLTEGGVTRVLCEGGGKLAAGLLAAGLVDEIALFTAGKAIGGDGIPGIGGFGLDRLAEAPEFSLERVEPVGSDVCSFWSRIPDR
jgi:diaminohydroxyphosphoribosylaminopyrimidine deaminase/5-amino-6-(5-phosphoribosylamino)uracil reductase